MHEKVQMHYVNLNQFAYTNAKSGFKNILERRFCWQTSFYYQIIITRNIKNALEKRRVIFIYCERKSDLAKSSTILLSYEKKCPHSISLFRSIRENSTIFENNLDPLYSEILSVFGNKAKLNKSAYFYTNHPICL